MAKYLKLGPKANTFYDASTDVSISNKQVVRVKSSAGDKPMLANAIATRHIVWATEQDYKDYLKEKGELERGALAKHHENLRNKGLMAGTVSAPGPHTLLNPISDDVEDTDDVEDADGGENNDDDDDEPSNKTELIDYLKVSPFISEDQRKSLTKLNKEELKTIYDQVKSK